MDPTHHYYTQHAAEFFHSTVGVDMAPIRQRFIEKLPPGAHILDAGCGSGRDARAFAEAGFRVSAFDASAELARLASAHCGFEVAARRFEEVDEVAQFDGIWCCASLLHVPLAAMPETLARLRTALRPGGTLYVSFKHGNGERTHSGRRMAHLFTASAAAWRRPRCTAWCSSMPRPSSRRLRPSLRGPDSVSDYGNGFKSSSLRKALCLSFAAAIAFSISTSARCVSSRSISASPTAVLMYREMFRLKSFFSISAISTLRE